MRTVCSLALLAALLSGCGPSDNRPALVAGQGTLTYKGEPLKYCTVRFVPLAAGPISSGVTDDKGAFTLTADDGRPGVVAGEHQVLVFDISNQQLDEDPLNPNYKPKGVKVKNPKLPAEWSNNRSPLRVTVSAGTPITLAP